MKLSEFINDDSSKKTDDEELMDRLWEERDAYRDALQRLVANPASYRLGIPCCVICSRALPEHQKNCSMDQALKLLEEERSS